MDDQLNAGFIGADVFEWWRAGALLLLNTIVFEIMGMMASVAGALLMEEIYDDDHHHHDHCIDALSVVVCAWALPRSLSVLISHACIIVQMEHLMLWSIFAPKVNETLAL